MEKRFAAMDLGTNTFHLLIAERDSDHYKEIIHLQQAVKLGAGGINKGLIQAAPFERGIKTMLDFHRLILENEVKNVKAIATSALRNAANGLDFVAQVKAKTGIDIDIIDGDAEASFIYKGIKAAGCLSNQNSLIVDIGGGSVELIIGNAHQVLWQQSFEIGAARLMDIFHQIDPIPIANIQGLYQYLDTTLADLFIKAAQYPIDHIIGSSGVFETYAGLLEQLKRNSFDLKYIKTYRFDKSALLRLIDGIIRSTQQERAATTGIIPLRIDMIVTASILVRFIIEKLSPAEMFMTTNSLKEGVLAQMMG